MELGFTRPAIQRRRRAGRLHRVHQGVYAVGHAALAPRGRLMAAVLACGPEAVLSHRHAADLWGVHHTSRAVIDVSTTRSRRTLPSIAAHCIERLGPDDREVPATVP